MKSVLLNNVFVLCFGILPGISFVCSAQAPDNYQVGYAANLNQGDSGVNFSNSGAQGGFAGGTVGNICVNAYTFDPSEEEVSCCSCLVTPDGLRSYSVNSDLVGNTLTSAKPVSVVIKLVATQPGTDQTGAYTICNPSAPTMTSLAAGLLAWGVTREPGFGTGVFGIVNIPFARGVLSQSELTGLTHRLFFNPTQRKRLWCL
ncbi:MAG: hypothetical protein ABSB35_02415 [Bryobacteraceae bacterium]